MRRIPAGIAGAAGVAVLSVVYLLEARGLPFGEWSAPDTGFFPRCLGLFSILLCTLLILREGLAYVRRAGNEASSAEPPERPSGLSGPLHSVSVVLTLLLYPLFLNWTGFLVSTPLMLFAVLRLVRYRTWLHSLAVALAITATTYVIFAWWMGVYFPKGFLG